MDFTDVRDHVAETHSFPVEADELAGNLEGIELEMPIAETETAGTVLERSGQTTFHSADGVFLALLGNVDDGYIPRKFYDDRAGARPSPHERPRQSI